MKRYAVVGAPIERVTPYLPHNYVARALHSPEYRTLISGEDDAGWTLDGYVIPRLASGLIFAREISVAPEISDSNV